MDWLTPELIGAAAAAIVAIYQAIKSTTRAKVAEAASRHAMEHVPDEVKELVAMKTLEEARVKFEKAEKWAPRLGWSRPLPDNFRKVERIK